MAYLLIVEDRPDQGKGILKRYGKRCHCVLKDLPEEAEDLIASDFQNIGGVLLDLRMLHRGQPLGPQDDYAGVAVMRAIRQYCGDHIPVIVATVLPYGHPAVSECERMGGIFCDKGDGEKLDNLIITHLIPTASVSPVSLTVEARLESIEKELAETKAILSEIQKRTA